VAFSLAKLFHRGFHQTKLDVQWWQEDFVWITKWHVFYVVPAQSRLCSSRPLFTNKVVFAIKGCPTCRENTSALCIQFVSR